MNAIEEVAVDVCARDRCKWKYFIAFQYSQQKTLREAYNSEYSQFVAVYGRRRIGKTFLVRETFEYSFTFQHAGAAKETLKGQLGLFRTSLQDFGYKTCPELKTWHEAFNQLKVLIQDSKSKKKIIFLDEAAWMDTPKSNFLSALEHFWNNWASNRKDVLLIICASATSWIINKVFKNRGGLHNRVTVRIPLAPFTFPPNPSRHICNACYVVYISIQKYLK